MEWFNTLCWKNFWNMGKKNHNNEWVVNMVGQMANFKCAEDNYSTQYSASYANPKTWWKVIDDPNDYLKSLAIKILSVTPIVAPVKEHSPPWDFFMIKEDNALILIQLK